MITPFFCTQIILRISKRAQPNIDLAAIGACAGFQEIVIVIASGVQVTVYDRRVNNQRLSFFRSIHIHVCDNAQLTYIDQQSSGDEVTLLSIQADAHSTVSYQGLYAGEGTIKTACNVVLAGVGAQADVRIGSIIKGTGNHNVKSVQQHDGSQTTSHCVVRSVVYDDAYTHYDGMIHIAKQLQNVVAHQTHKSMLMGEHARAVACPNLKIFSHDVVCGHGSAIGQLDDEQLLYMRCRGVRETDARRLLLGAFFADLYTDEHMVWDIEGIFFKKLY